MNSTVPLRAAPVLADAVTVIRPLTISMEKPAGSGPAVKGPEASISIVLSPPSLEKESWVGVAEIKGTVGYIEKGGTSVCRLDHLQLALYAEGAVAAYLAADKSIEGHVLYLYGLTGAGEYLKGSVKAHGIGGRIPAFAGDGASHHVLAVLGQEFDKRELENVGAVLLLDLLYRGVAHLCGPQLDVFRRVASPVDSVVGNVADFFYC